MAPPRTGKFFPCFICGKEVYRAANYLKRAHYRMTCKSLECKSKQFAGENNPFWGKVHSEETMLRIRDSLRSRPYPRKKGGPPKGYKHTPEAKAKMSAALRERWITNRDKMLKGPESMRTIFRRPDSRYRKGFSPMQQREWKEPSCKWCGSTDELQLDHIIAVLCGGGNERRNAQTLCKPCNIWKMAFVDRPLFLAGATYKGASQ